MGLFGVAQAAAGVTGVAAGCAGCAGTAGVAGVAGVVGVVGVVGCAGCAGVAGAAGCADDGVLAGVAGVGLEVFIGILLLVWLQCYGRIYLAAWEWASTNQSHLSMPRETSVHRSAVSASSRALASLMVERIS